MLSCSDNRSICESKMEPFVEFAPSYEHVMPTNLKNFDWPGLGKGRLMDSKKKGLV